MCIRDRFDTYVAGSQNVSYSLHLLGTSGLELLNLTLENAPKADDTLPWGIGNGIYAPISISTPYCMFGHISIRGCTINQTRDYFIGCKHAFGIVVFSGTTVNMSDDAVAFICNDFGNVIIGWYNSSITSGYQLTTGRQGRDVLFAGSINKISTTQTWFSSIPEDLLPDTDNAYNNGDDSHRWKLVRGVKSKWDELVIPTSAPGTPEAGSMYFDTGTGTLYIYDGTTWKSITLT